MDAGAAAFLFTASVAAGAVNSVAGGGTLLSFPAAIAAGLPPIIANATNAVAMVPGSLAAAWTLRREIASARRLTTLLCLPAITGGLVGAAILRRTSEQLFSAIVPWLVLAATLLILFQELILRLAPARPSPSPALSPPPSVPLSPPASVPLSLSASAAPSVPLSPRQRGEGQGEGSVRPARLALLLACQFLVAIYGGYFGAAMGIVMLAFLGLAAPRDFHQTNAIKNVMAVVINGAASADFVAHHLVDLPIAALMTAGSITGGVLGARLARKTAPRHIRRLVVAIGFAMTALLAYRRHG